MGGRRDGRGLDEGRRRTTLKRAAFGHQHVRTFAGDGLRRVRALPGCFAHGAWTRGGLAAGAPPPPDRDLPATAPRVLLGRGTRGGRAPGARGLGQVHGEVGGVPGSPGPGSPRRPHPRRGRHDTARLLLPRERSRARPADPDLQGGDDPSTLDYLGERGLVPGRLLCVREVRELDGVVTVEDEDGGAHALGEPLARAVYVRAV